MLIVPFTATVAGLGETTTVPAVGPVPVPGPATVTSSPQAARPPRATMLANSNDRETLCILPPVTVRCMVTPNPLDSFSGSGLLRCCLASPVLQGPVDVPDNPRSVLPSSLPSEHLRPDFHIVHNTSYINLLLPFCHRWSCPACGVCKNTAATGLVKTKWFRPSGSASARDPDPRHPDPPYGPSRTLSVGPPALICRPPLPP